MSAKDRIKNLAHQVLSDGWARLETVEFDYQHTDGRWEHQRREIYHRGHGVAVLPCDPVRRRVLLVRQFRLPVVLADAPVVESAHDARATAASTGNSGADTAGSSAPGHAPGHALGHALGLSIDSGFILEVPAGIVESEGVEASARAELWQEVGLRPRSLEFVCRAFVSPGSVTECLYHYVALYSPTDRRSAGGGLAAEGEDIEVLEYSFDEAYAAIAEGHIVDAKTVLLLQHAALHVF